MRWQRRGFAVGVCGGLASLSGGLLAAEPPAANAPRPAGRGRERGAERTAIRAEVVQSPAWVWRNGVQQPLQPGDSLPQGTEVQTGPGATLALRMPEGSVVYLGEQTRMAVQQLMVTRSTQGELSMSTLLRLVDGFVRYATTPLAKAVGRRDVRIGLRTSTLGIRGTDVWAMTDAVHDAACLFEGRIGLTTQQGDLALEQPSAFWAWFFERAPTPVGVATPAELAKFMASVEVRPGQGLAVENGVWRVELSPSADYRMALRNAVALRQSGYAAHVWERAASGRFAVEIRHLATQADAEALLARVRSTPGLEQLEGRVGRLA